MILYKKLKSSSIQPSVKSLKLVAEVFELMPELLGQ